MNIESELEKVYELLRDEKVWRTRLKNRCDISSDVIKALEFKQIELKEKLEKELSKKIMKG